MRNISGRINTIEKQLSVGKEDTRLILLTPSIDGAPNGASPKDMKKLGAIETWITYHEQLKAQERPNPNFPKSAIIIDLDVDEEYQARATKSNQKQPFAEK